MAAGRGTEGTRGGPEAPVWHFREETAPGTCYRRWVDPVDGHISADVKNLGALQEFLVLNGLFARHPDHGLFKVRGGDFFSLEEERDFTPAW